ncbi:MAG: MMPL family transporter [Archangium sp.]|nr:MMPL family transporter [Archangium sp.]
MASDDTRLSKLVSAYVDFSFRTPWLVVAAFVAIGAAAAGLASTLEFRGDFIELLPEQSDEVKDLRFVEQRAGGGGYLVVQVRGLTREARREFGAAYAKALEAHPELVRYVESRFDIDFFRRRALWLLTAQQLSSLRGDVEARVTYEKAIANPLYVDLGEEAPPADFAAIEKKYGNDAPQSEFLESHDGDELYLYVKPAQLAADLDFNRKLVATAREVAKQVPGFTVDTPELVALKKMPTVEAQHLQVNFTGAYVIRIEEDSVMQADLARGAVLATILSLAIILLASRRVTALIIVAAPVSVGIAMTFAFAKIIVGHLNPVTGFLGAILIGLGIEYGVHLSMRYWEERAGLSALDALRTAVVSTFSGALTSAFTNAAAFFVLVLAEFEAFQQFGKIASFGVMATVVAAYALGPAVLAISERLRPFTPRVAAGGGDAAAKSSRMPGRGSLIAVLATVLVAMGYSVWVAPSVGFERDLKKLKGESPATELDDHIIEQLGIIMTPALVHVATLEDARAVQRIANEVKRDIGKTSAFARVASLADMLPSDVPAQQPELTKLHDVVSGLPKSVLEGEQGARVRQFVDMTTASPWVEGDVPAEIRRRFSALQGGGTFVLIFPRYSGYDVSELKLWADELNELMRRVHAAGVAAHVLDGNRLAAKIFDLIKKDGPTVMLAAAIVVFAMIWLSLRSFKEAWLVAGPLYIGMTCIFGAMHLFGVHLNFLNVVVLPNLLAIAVDNSVHLFHRYHEEGPGSLPHIMRTTGLTAVVATLSNAAGYGAMLIARHEGLRSVGVMAVLGVTCTFVGTTIFFPALLALLEQRKRAPADA